MREATVLVISLTALLGGLFFRMEMGLAEPLIPMRLLKSRNFRVAGVIGILWSAGSFAWFVITALYLQRILSYGPLHVGLSFLPSEGIAALFSVCFVSKFVVRFGTVKTLCCGNLLAVSGLLLFSRAPANGTFVVDVLPGMLMLGVGTGLTSAPLLLAAMEEVEPQESGLASGIVNTAFMIGGALGLAALASSAEVRTESLLTAGFQHQISLNEGYRFAFRLAALLTLAGAGFAASLSDAGRSSEESGQSQ